MTEGGAGDTRSSIGGGTQQGPVLRGRDFRNVHIETVVQAAAAPVALAQLPQPVAGFTGRETELAQITGLLDPAGSAGAVVVSAMAGLAGVGKTALAIQAAHASHAASWFGGGVLFIDLHGYDDQAVQPAQALDALLRALGIPAEDIPPGTEERAGLYRSVLAAITDPVLVVADNASSETQVRPLLPGVGPHRMLVTSRHTLAGLGARLLDIEVLDARAGVMMLEQALRTARPSDDRLTSDPSAADRLAAVCGGLPLALRIIAALLAVDLSLTASELADLLADEVSRLKALRYDEGGADSTLSVAAAFDLSYRCLGHAAARLFRLVSINPGPDVSTAAAAVLADQPIYETRTVLGHLVKAHLIEPSGTGTNRWRMHDLLRLYAHQLIDSRSEPTNHELEQARDRLLAYYSDKARAGDNHLRVLPSLAVPEGFASQDQALAWLDAERPNLIAAVALAARTGSQQIAMRLSLSLGEYLYWRRRFDDLLAVLPISREAAHRLNDQASEARAINLAGIALQETRRFDEAITAHQDAAAQYRVIGDRGGLGLALNNLGAALTRARRFDEAIAAHQEAVVIHWEIGNRRAEGMALNNLGLALMEVRRFDEAIASCQDAVAIARETGDRRREGRALNNLGKALREVGRFDEAIASCQDAVAIARETGDRHREGTALGNLGAALTGARRFDEAIMAHREELAISRENDERDSEGLTLGNLGIALWEVGRLDEAIAAHLDAVAILRGIGDRDGEGWALTNLGASLRTVGRFDEAITAYRDAVAIFRETGDRHREGRALDNLGAALREVRR